MRDRDSFIKPTEFSAGLAQNRSSDLSTIADLTEVPPEMKVPIDMVFIPGGVFQMGSQDKR